MDPLYSDLSDRQLKIVQSPAQTKLLVVAGPGTGKTHTLIRRCCYLVMEGNLNPQSEVLVLSFSRAAVAEIRSRLVQLARLGFPDDIRFLNVRTFDSFSTLLLKSIEEDVDLSSLDYDARIRLVIARLTEPESEASQALCQFKHVLVDEVQDLVGERAQLVQLILQRIQGGFTLCGDPAQGIFDYLVRRSRTGISSTAFSGWVRKVFSDELGEFSLEQNFRVSSPSVEVASQARSLVMDSTANQAEAFSTLWDIIGSLESAGSVQMPDQGILNLDKKRISILCRTNAEALFTSNQLSRKGLKCVLPPKIEDKGIPAWVGRIFSNYEQDRISNSKFHERWRQLVGKGISPGANAAWDLLKITEGRDHEPYASSCFAVGLGIKGLLAVD